MLSVAGRRGRGRGGGAYGGGVTWKIHLEIATGHPIYELKSMEEERLRQRNMTQAFPAFHPCTSTRTHTHPRTQPHTHPYTPTPIHTYSPPTYTHTLTHTATPLPVVYNSSPHPQINTHTQVHTHMYTENIYNVKATVSLSCEDQHTLQLITIWTSHFPYPKMTQHKVNLSISDRNGNTYLLDYVTSPHTFPYSRH